MSSLTASHLAGFEHQLDLDLAKWAATDSIAERRLYTYLASYPHMRATVAGFGRITGDELYTTISMVYGLMPTAMNLRRGDMKPFLAPLNALRDTGQRLAADELDGLKSLVNNSIVGTSKLLHFLAPEIYPVWDSRINRFLNGQPRPETNSVSRYRDYLASFDRLRVDADFEPLRASIEGKLGYPVSAARACELIMYMSDALQLSHVAPPAGQQPAPTPAAPAPRPKVPRYKRDAYTFVSNLGPVTLDTTIPDTLLRDGYLLSEHYTTSETLRLAAIAHARRNLLISDNGNWTRMNALGRQFSAPGAALLARARTEAEAGGVTQATRTERAAMMTEIATACADALAALDGAEVIATQLKMQPDYMIGLEDFTVPVMMMAGLMDRVFAPDPQEIAPYQALTRELFARQIDGQFGFAQALSETSLYLVIHAFDYASAKQGAGAARGILKDGIAISYGAPMASRRWIREIKLGGVVEDLGENLPESYLAANALTLGVVNGHADDIPVHVLGVGTPILIMMIGFLLKGARAVSIDSSAPMLDAFDGRIYGTRSAFLKMRMYRLAAYCLIDDLPYESDTPFFKAFETLHPSDWAGLRATLGITATSDRGEIEARLESDQALVRAHIPFFTRLTNSSDPFFWQLRVARAGHNYSILREIVDHVRRRRDNWPALKAWTEAEIARYAAAGTPKWARAVEKSFELTIKHKLVDGLD
jgi:hypothetical protein